MNYLQIVNKEIGVSKEYIPKNLVKVKLKTGGNKKIYLEKKTYRNIKKLLRKANKIFDTELVVDSGYRTYYYQENLMEELLKEKGEKAYLSLAKPGHSEHQLGLAVDIGFYQNGKYIPKFQNEDFANEFKWLEDNAHKYGFILRYPQDKSDITGYIYEPWHLRYVGRPAKTIYEKGITLEEYMASKLQ